MDTWTAADGGPSYEYYRELAETQGHPWPEAHAITRAQHAALTAPPSPPILAGRDDGWRCPRCGAPAIVPDLEATLPYRCGFLELADGRWIHA